MNASPGDPVGSPSAGREDELQRRRPEDEDEQHREDDGGDRTHRTSLTDGPGEIHGPLARTGPPERIGASVRDLQSAATHTIDQWLARLEQVEPTVLAIEKDANRRFVRLRGEEKSVFTVWLLIGQHTLHHETFVMPAPIENHAEFYAHLLRRNHTLRGLAFTIGAEDGLYLEGRTPLQGLDADGLDAIIGMHYEAVERCFRSAMRIGWRSMFRG